MKKFKALGMIAIILTMLISCGKGSSPTPPPPPPPPPPVANPSIVSFSLSKSVINFNGQPGLGSVDITWASTNGNAYLNDSAVTNIGALKVDILQNKSFTLKVIAPDKPTAEEVKTVTVNINAILAKITGPTGKIWKLTSFKARLSGSGSPFQETITECEKKWIHTFYPNGKRYLDFGSDLNCGPGTVWNSFFTFDSNSMEVFDNMTSSFVKQKVSFPTSTTMFFESKENGSDYQRTYVAL